MKTKLILLAIAAIFLATCRGGTSVRRDQQNYEVVEEGSADGVTSTIHAPGETPPSLTGTNADTTTTFTLPTTQTSLPPNTAGTYTPGYPPTTYPVATAQPQPPPPPVHVIVTQPSPQPQPAPPPPTDTMTTTVPKPPTDTAEEPDEQPPPTDTSTTTTPPPPPI